MALFEPSPRLMKAVEEFRLRRGASLSSLGEGVRQLSRMFVEREGWKGDYLILPHLLDAYVAYYVPVNALKIRWILEEMRRYAPEFLKRPLRVLDFGCGPGTALLGLAEVSDLPHRVSACDRVLEVLPVAKELVQAATSLDIESVSDTFPPGLFDLILASNVYTEMEDESGLARLLEALDPSGYLILVEPAQKDPTQRLMQLRDRLAGEGWKVAAPCPGMAACPMRAQEELWCHEDVRWARPGWIQKIDDRAGLDKDFLKFSYLVVTKNGAGLSADARVVSHLHREKGKMWAWLCGSGPVLTRAELLKRDLKDENRDFRDVQRGDLLSIPGFAAAERWRFPPATPIRRT